METIKGRSHKKELNTVHKSLDCYYMNSSIFFDHTKMALTDKTLGWYLQSLHDFLCILPEVKLYYITAL